MGVEVFNLPNENLILIGKWSNNKLEGLVVSLKYYNPLSQTPGRKSNTHINLHGSHVSFSKFESFGCAERKEDDLKFKDILSEYYMICEAYEKENSHSIIFSYF